MCVFAHSLRCDWRNEQQTTVGLGQIQWSMESSLQVRYNAEEKCPLLYIISLGHKVMMYASVVYLYPYRSLVLFYWLQRSYSSFSWNGKKLVDFYYLWLIETTWLGLNNFKRWPLLWEPLNGMLRGGSERNLITGPSLHIRKFEECFLVCLDIWVPALEGRSVVNFFCSDAMQTVMLSHVAHRTFHGDVCCFSDEFATCAQSRLNPVKFKVQVVGDGLLFRAQKSWNSNFKQAKIPWSE